MPALQRHSTQLTKLCTIFALSGSSVVHDLGFFTHVYCSALPVCFTHCVCYRFGEPCRGGAAAAWVDDDCHALQGLFWVRLSLAGRSVCLSACLPACLSVCHLQACLPTENTFGVCNALQLQYSQMCLVDAVLSCLVSSQAVMTMMFLDKQVVLCGCRLSVPLLLPYWQTWGVVMNQIHARSPTQG